MKSGYDLALGLIFKMVSALLIALPLFAAAAQDRPAAIIGVVDIEYVLQNSLAAQKLYQKIDQQRLLYAQEWQEEERRLRQMERDLTQETLSLEDFNRQRDRLQNTIAQTQRQIESRQEELARILSDNLRQIRSLLLDVIARVTEEEGVNLVLFKRQVIVVDKSYDMTLKVLDRLNHELPEIQLPMFSNERK